jgi:hypothetical protein
MQRCAVCYAVGMVSTAQLLRRGSRRPSGTALPSAAAPFAAHSGAKTISTYLPNKAARFKGDGQPVHLGCGTPEVPVSFTLGGKSYSAARVALASDFKSYLALAIEGKGPLLANGRRLNELVRIPVATWDVPTLTMAFAVLAANVVRMDVHVPGHAKDVWTNALGFASQITPVAYLAAVNKLLKDGGAAFTLAAGVVTNARVNGGGGSTAMVATSGDATPDGLKAALSGK